jgi:mono/diheme cytochrome c family protein
MPKSRRTIGWSALIAAVALPAASTFISANAAAADSTTLVSQPHSSAIPADAAAEKWALLGKYCSKCHNTEDWAGGIAFESMSAENIPEDAQTWEKAVRKLRGGLMPPAGNPRPDTQAVQSFVAWMEGNLDHAASGRTEPGRVALHRLNRKEYANAIRDLLEVQMDPEGLLPRDDARDGFDNVADALQVSPSFLDQYLAAARTVAVTALGNVQARPVGTTYSAESGEQFFHESGLPPGTRGGLAVTHAFAADGEYVINIANMAQAIWVYNMEFENHLVVTLDRRKIYETTIGGEEDMKAIDQRQDPAVDAINQRLKNIRFKTTAGPHEIGVTFLQRSFAESEDRLQQHVPGGGQDRVLRVSSFEVRGPLNASGVSDTPARQRVFICRPNGAVEETPCARKILQRLAERAFRRPVSDADVADLMKFYQAGRRDGGFEAGIRQALTALLADPEFLYRAELPPTEVVAGNVYRIGDLELASRLSFFLWSSLPDDELLRAARGGELRDNAKLAVQVRRLLADPRSQTLASNFAFQWLNMAKLGEIQPDVALFPMLNGDVRQDFREELRLFIDSVFRENRSVMELLGADYTFLNERVALLYGIRDVKGDRFRRVQLTDSRRFGLLGKGAVLMVTSYPNRTAPVLRGAFVLERLMGTPPAAPPPNVGALKENKEGAKALTVREMMAAHRSNPSCNGCHGIMDPLGFALDSFDAVGQQRTVDRFAGVAIDTSGELPDGRVLKGPDDLRNALLQRPDQFVQTLTEKLMTYALGRTLDYKDMPAVRAIVRSAATDNYRFETLVMNLVTSPEFQMARSGVPAGLKTAGLQPVTAPAAPAE